ncbi:SDR family NAD(P)-dependent oxidoreductase [Paenibacillus sp. TH7-28]
MELELPEEAERGEGYAYAPGMVDGALQALIGVMASDPGSGEGKAYLPFFTEEVKFLHRLPRRCIGHIQFTGSLDDGGILRSDIGILDQEGRELVLVRGFCVRAAGIAFGLEGVAASERASGGTAASSKPAKPEYTTAEETLPALQNAESRLLSPARLLGQHLRKTVARRLDSAADQLSGKDTFLSVGLDSADLVEMAGELERTFAITLFPTVFFEYQTMDALGEYMLENFGDQVISTLERLDVMNDVPAAPETASALLSSSSSNPPDHAIENDAPSDSIWNTSEAQSAAEQREEQLYGEGARDEIAIIGLAGMFPKAASLEEFWRNIRDGVDCIEEIPESRWEIDRYFSSDKQAEDGIYIRKSGFIPGLEQFDPAFFNISPKEAKEMDPQQRVFITVCYQALENAGYGGSKLFGTRTGVYAGMAYSQYKDQFDRMGPFTGIGNHEAILSNRVSYFLNLQGPSLTVNTLCSSSAVAIHLASKSLLNGECDYALAGGVFAVLNPNYYLGGSKLQAFSPDSACKTFDRKANGYVPGEGAGVLLLKPLKKAIRDRDFIHAVIKGSAVNHDGRSNNLTAPNAQAQEQVIAMALKDAGVHPESISYMEAHGTGTSLGDPVEISGLTRAYRQFTDKKGFCAIGSVKTNIGHLEPAAGVAGIAKIVMAMKHEMIPASLHFEEPNPFLNLAQTPFYVNDKPSRWVSQGPLRAGLSSFGMGGTNVHLILEEYRSNRCSDKTQPQRNLFVLSGRSEQALQASVDRFVNFLDSGKNPPSLKDICYTASTGKGHYAHRLAVFANSVEELLEKLRRVRQSIAQSFTVGGDAQGLIYYSGGRKRPVSFHFGGPSILPAGRIAEWLPNMSDAYPAVKMAADVCTAVLQQMGEEGIVARLKRIRGGAAESMPEQVLLSFAWEYAWTSLFESWGVRTVCATYSEGGEFAAAVALGLLSPEEALQTLIRGMGKASPALRQALNKNLPGAEDLILCAGGNAAGFDRDRLVCPVLTQHTDPVRYAEQAIACLYWAGAEVDWEAYYAGSICYKTELPEYPFDTSAYWTNSLNACTETDKLARSVEIREKRRFLKPAENPVWNDHRVRGMRVLPGAAILDFAASVFRNEGNTETLVFEDVVFHQRFEGGIGEEAGLELKADNILQDGRGVQFQVIGIDRNRSEKEENVCMSGRVLPVTVESAISLSLEDIRERCSHVADPETMYAMYEGIGITYLSWYRTVKDLRVGDGELLARIEHEHDADSLLHPAVLDGALQSMLGLFMANAADDRTGYLPFHIRRMTVHRPLLRECYCYARQTRDGSPAGTGVLADIWLSDRAGNVLVKIEGYRMKMFGTGQSAPSSDRPATNRLFHGINWVRINPDIAVEPFRPAGWIILGESSGLTGLLADRLAKAGSPVHFLSPGETLPAVLEELGESTAVLDVRAFTEAAVGNVRDQDGEERFLLPLFRSLKELSSIRRTGPLHYYLVTNRGVYLPGRTEALEPYKSSLWGLAKAAALESAALRMHCVDGEYDNRRLDSLLAALLKAPEAAVCREGEIYVPQITAAVTQDPPASAADLFKPGGAYVITGGLGGIGLETAKYLAGKQAGWIVLVNRSPLPNRSEWDRMLAAGNDNQDLIRKIRAIREIEASGAKVILLQADVANAAGLQQVLTQARTVTGPFHGVFHAAGYIKDSLIRFKSENDFRSVLLPKINGIQNLNSCTENDPLAVFVAFSSIASVTGSVGQTDYSAANAYMDAFIAARRLSGKPGISLNWSIWGEVGMGTAFAEIHRSRGVRPLGTEEAMEALESSFFREDYQLIIADLMDVPWVVRQPEIQLPKNPQIPVPEPGEELPEAGEALESLALDFAEHSIKTFLSENLDYQIEDIDPHAAFTELGVDSILGVKLVRHLEKLAGAPLESTLSFDYPNVSRLAEFLVEHFGPSFETAAIKSGYRRPLTAQHEALGSGTGPDSLMNGLSESPAPIKIIADAADAVSAGSNGGTGLADREEDIAVIGMSCRFPGADSPDEYWDLLRNGKHAIFPFPKERMHDGRQRELLELCTGGYIRDVYHFDPHFFHISPKEAEFMDPQQRLLLKTVWEAMEDGGVAGRINDAEVGVFIGAGSNDYKDLAGSFDSAIGTGSALSILANRISYMFDWKGPSMVIDTACSSSLVAIDSACESLRRGDCKMAVAGGVGLILTPFTTMVFREAGMIAPDGKCKTFDRSANGYVRGEGAGVLLLKPVHRALADGDPIHAVIKGSAINQDGKTNGLTAPNVFSQKEVIAKALKRAGVTAEEISYVEAHGTGTSLGDPIEIKGLKEAFAPFTSKRNFCGIGSVKTNIGHLETAAGIAGVIKVILCLRHKELPPTLHFNTLNPMIELNDSPFYVNDKLRFWDTEKTRRIASISSFGFGGTNAHVVLGEAPERGTEETKEQECDRLFACSARSRDGLIRQLRRYETFLGSHQKLSLADVCYTALAGRKHFPHRVVVTANSVEDLHGKLGRLLVEFGPGGSDPVCYAHCKIPEKRSDALSSKQAIDRYLEEWYAFGGPDRRKLLMGELANAYLKGVDISWGGFFRGENCRVVPLPGYQFEEEEYFCALPDGQGRSKNVAQNGSYLERANEDETVSPALEFHERSPKPSLLPNEELVRRIAGIFERELTERLKFKPDDIDLDAGLNEYGFDSIFAVQVLKVFEDYAGVPLDPTLLFDFSSIRSFSAYLADEYEEAFQTVFASERFAALVVPAGEESGNDEQKPGPAGCREPQVPDEINQVPAVQADSGKCPGSDSDKPSVFGEWSDSDGLSKPMQQFAPFQVRTTDVAVIGISGRFPGADSLQSFWEALERGYDGVRAMPLSRLDGLKPEARRQMALAQGGFLENVDAFDPAFFGISDEEAKYMDPQQRLFLEVVWEAIEDAGYGNRQLSGTKTGVYLGVSTNDYGHVIASGANGEFSPHAGTGNSFSVAANRVSYLLNLKGPSMAVDTACSSSLMAVHLACQALKCGEISTAIAGGVNLILSPGPQNIFEKAGVISQNQRCRSFDDSADGYVRGEGAGALVLKPLDKALEDGDHVYAVIKSTAVNQNGSANRLTAPNGSAQTDVICEAWDAGGIDPRTLTYYEAHGTGTSLGDSIEFRGITQAFRRYTDQSAFCALGTVKTNIGHLEPASGVAGILKIILMLKRKQIPPTLHFCKPSSKINFVESPIYINDTLMEWLAPTGVSRRAAISAFGFAGANAHLVIEEAPPAFPAEEENIPTEQLLTLSAKSTEALRSRMRDLLKAAEPEPGSTLHDLCYSLNRGRDHFRHRLALVLHSTADLRPELQRCLASPDLAGLKEYKDSRQAPRKTVFMFTGQGSQFKQAGAELYRIEPVFRAAMQKCQRILESQLKLPLTDYLYESSVPGKLLNSTSITQPLIFSIGYSLLELWDSWGIRPDAVMGHSLGEYTAAVAAGVMSLEDGLHLVATRGRLMERLCQPGVMYTVFASKEKVAGWLERYEGHLWAAAYNGPQSTVIAGGKEQAEALVSELKQLGIDCFPLAVSHAFHSDMMLPMTEEFRNVAAGISYSPARIPILSNVTGDFMEIGGYNADYWVRHILQPVDFHGGINRFLQAGYSHFLELGGRNILAKLVSSITCDQQVNILSSLEQENSNYGSMMKNIQHFYLNGYTVNWDGVYAGRKGRRIPLPAYPFERKRYWQREKPRLLQESEPATSSQKLRYKGMKL